MEMVHRIASEEALQEEGIIMDFRKGGVGDVRTDDGRFYFSDTNFPKYFKYYPPLDNHFCGNWGEITREEYVSVMNEYLEKKKKELKELKELIKNA